jgi:hypothetical protein
LDFIDWCDLVLDKIIELTAASIDARNMGVGSNQQLPAALFGQDATSQPEFHESKARLGMYDALNQLADCYLVEEKHGMFYKPTDIGEQVAKDKTELWEAFCNETLKPEQEQVLRVVNRLSPHEAVDHAWVERIDHDALLAELGWSSDRDGFNMLWAVSTELEEKHIVKSLKRMGAIDLKATYRGLVWEHRRAITLESKAIDELVAEWETTSVDFKREQHTNTADEKAEFVKDVIALANTQASGQRWLIIGFEDKTHEYHGAPDPKITLEHLEQLMSQYTDPVVGVRYEVVAYRAGAVGKLEVVRDPKKLPHRVAKSVGDKKRIERGDVFVRHGSLSERPTDGELRAIEQEGERARPSTSTG